MATAQAASSLAEIDGRSEWNAAVMAATANRRNGAHAVLAAASALVAALPADFTKVRALVLLLLLLLGCTTVHLAMCGRHRRTVARAAARRVDRSPQLARLRWTGFHALLLLGGSQLLLAPTYWTAAAARPTQQLLQVLGAYAIFVLGAVLVLVSTSYDGVPCSVRPAAAAAARGLDGLLFAGSFATASDANDLAARVRSARRSRSTTLDSGH